jgi:glycosyltransferase involved in cell wall biosynthesis
LLIRGKYNTADTGIPRLGTAGTVPSAGGITVRLTLITETFPPEVNGVARTLGHWEEAFRARGHVVRVIRPRQPDQPDSSLLVRGMPLPFYREVRLGLATPGHLGRLLLADPPDLVHIATEGPLGLAGLIACRMLGFPVVSSFHTHYDAYLTYYGLGFLKPVGRAYLRWFHNRGAGTFVPTDAARRSLERIGFRNVLIWPRGVDNEQFHPRHRSAKLRAELGLGPRDVLLLYVGRLAPEKNLGSLLDAFRRLRNRGEGRPRLALVGDGPLRSSLEAARVDDVILPGFRLGSELARWYASADLFAFPSLTETFGNVVLEAQASGLPVVGFDSPALRARIDAEDGILVPPGGDLADAMALLCRDVGRRRVFGAAARRKAEGQDWDSIFDRLEQDYYEVVRTLVPASPRIRTSVRGRWSAVLARSTV